MKSKFITALLPLMIFAMPLSASLKQKTSFTYAGLYKSLKTSKQSSYSQLSLHFLLLENKTRGRCPTQQVFLSDGKSEHEVLINEDGALLLPLDKNLKTDHAAISFETEKNIGCHLSMQISVADFELDTFTKTKMISWFNQFDELYTDLAGWPAKYFMPNVNGIAVHTSQKVINVMVNNGKVNEFKSENNILLLKHESLENLPDDSELIFNNNIVKVLPTLEK